jgi:hypothetical protein
MDHAARVAFVQAQTVCALAEIEGMKAENQHRLSLGHSIAYDHAAFMAVPDTYQIGWNTVIDYLRDG